jgi:hypothetical protein
LTYSTSEEEAIRDKFGHSWTSAATYAKIPEIISDATGKAASEIATTKLRAQLLNQCVTGPSINLSSVSVFSDTDATGEMGDVVMAVGSRITRPDDDPGYG